MHSNNIKIQLKDFPGDVYILLEDEFRAKFFKTAWKINRSYRHLAKKIGVSNPTMLSWRRGKINCTNKDQYCSMWAIHEIINYSKDSHLWDLNLEEIQNNIKSIRAMAGNHKIYDINLPIEDSIYLREIVTHLLCDGCALDDKHRTSKYSLTKKEAVEEFKKELSIFGKQPNTKIIKEFRRINLPVYVFTFSKAITKILISRFRVNFRSKEARLPSEFLEGKRPLLVAIVRAFLIDEGCIKDRNISFCSGSLGLIEDLRLICNKLGYQCQKIKKCNRTYYLDISPNSFEKAYTDIMNIGPLPIKEKQEVLELGINILHNKPNFRELNEQILSILKHKPSTKLELAKLLFVNTKTIGERLLKLEKESIVKRSEKRNNGKGGAFIWTINGPSYY